ENLEGELAKSELMRPEWARTEKLTTFAGQPLIFRGKILGMLGVFLRSHLGEASFQALRTFADHAAVSIANARAFDEVQVLQGQLGAERDQLRLLLEVTSLVGKELELEALFLAMGKALRQVLPHDFTNLVLAQEDGMGRLHTLMLPDGTADKEG